MAEPDSQKDIAIRKSFEMTARKVSDILDLNRKEIQQIPNGLAKLDLTNLKYLYLERNRISSLPEDFFICLVSLEWLDLRNNKLCEIPRNIGEHKNLKTLLLGRNQLTFLPVELGFVKTLTGLNLSDNPLEEPPQTVIIKGISAIKKYLLAKLGIDPEEVQSDEAESEYQSSAGSGDNSQADDKETTTESCSIENKKAETACNYLLSNRSHTEVVPVTHSVSPKVAMSYYGALLGEVPNSYIFKPWKKGVFFTKEEMADKNLEKDNGK